MTNELADFMASIAAEEDADQARIELLLEPYRNNQDAQNLYGKEAKALGARIKEWLALHPEVEEITDGEHGLTARLQTRRLPGHAYDLVAIIENNPALFARLVSTRALRIDHDLAIAAGLGGEVGRYEVPVGETAALIVSRSQ